MESRLVWTQPRQRTHFPCVQAVAPRWPSTFGPWNTSMLISVVERGDESTARLLINEMGVDPNHIAMDAGGWGVEPDCSAVDRLIGFSIKPVEKYEREGFWPNVGNTAILTAICRGNASMVRVLKSLGADINLESPRHVKFYYENDTLKKTEVLLTHCPLLFAIEREDPAMVLQILELGGDPTVSGWTRTRDNLLIRGNALQLANLRFEGRYPDVIKALLRSIENVEKNKDLETAFEDRAKLEQVSTELTKTRDKLANLSRFFQNLKKSLECNICIDVPESTSKIYSCLNGHAICELCLRRIHECPLCKLNFRLSSPVRLRIAESIVADVASLNLTDLDFMTQL